MVTLVLLWALGGATALRAEMPPHGSGAPATTAKAALNRYCPNLPPARVDGRYCVAFSRPCRFDQIEKRDKQSFWRETAALPLTLQAKPLKDGGLDLSVELDIHTAPRQPKNYRLHDVKNPLAGIDLFAKPPLGKKDKGVVFREGKRDVPAKRNVRDDARKRWTASMPLGKVAADFSGTLEGVLLILGTIRGDDGEVDGTLPPLKSGDINPHVKWKVVVKRGEVRSVALEVDVDPGGVVAPRTASMETNIPGYRLDVPGGYGIEGCVPVTAEQHKINKEFWDKWERENPRSDKDLPP